MATKIQLGLLDTWYRETDGSVLESGGVSRTGGAHTEARVLKSGSQAPRTAYIAFPTGAWERAAEDMVKRLHAFESGLRSPQMESKYYEMELPACSSLRCLYNVEQLNSDGPGKISILTFQKTCLFLS